MNKHNRRTSSKKSAGGTLIGLFVGLVIGVVAAAVVVWYIQRTPPPFANKPPTTPQSSQNTAPVALPAKPGDPVPERRFDFYEILAGKNDPASGGTAAAPTAAPTTAPTPASATPAETTPPPKPTVDEKPKTEVVARNVYLQTGSFQNAADADNQKAKLAMMGMEASVQQAMLQDKVWYRVRVGPYKADEANHVRAELAKNSINAAVVK